MKLRVLGSSGGEGQGQRASSFLVNDRVLVDAGTVPSVLSVEEQTKIEYVLVSHAHLDHVTGLAYLTDTLAITRAQKPVTAAGIAPVVDALRTHSFNNSLWPDFSTIPSTDAPVLRFRTLLEDAESRVNELSVRAVPVDHTVPTTGFIIHDGHTGFVYSGDTGPTERIWAAAKGLRGLRAVIVETTFPNRLDTIARASKHLTPALLLRELEKIPPDVPLWIYHIKPHFREETTEELMRIGSSRICILEQDKTYTL